MRIGIIGSLGIVGSALKHGFTRIGHDVIEHDIRITGSKIENVADTDLVFVCVPTPSRINGSCETIVVENVVAELNAMDYRGLVVIKSTVTPGTTGKLNNAYHWLRLAFCPEFLREKAGWSDFVESHEVCIIGAYTKVDFDLIEAAHRPLPKSYARMRPIEAELAKYFCNTLNTAKIIFANQFFEICDHFGADYSEIKNAVARRASVGTHYLDCNKNFRGFGGACLPKDLSAIASVVAERGIDAPMFEWLMRANEKLKRPS